LTWPHFHETHPLYRSNHPPRLAVIQLGARPSHSLWAACCPRTLELLDRQAAIALDPKYSRQDVDDLVAGIRKAYRG
jgi:hypothetical protein